MIYCDEYLSINMGKNIAIDRCHLAPALPQDMASDPTETS